MTDSPVPPTHPLPMTVQPVPALKQVFLVQSNDALGWGRGCFVYAACSTQEKAEKHAAMISESKVVPMFLDAVDTFPSGLTCFRVKMDMDGLVVDVSPCHPRPPENRLSYYHEHVKAPSLFDKNEKQPNKAMIHIWATSMMGAGATVEAMVKELKDAGEWFVCS